MPKPIKRVVQPPSYPTTSLEFLQSIKTHTNEALLSATKIKIIVVGAGLGGLATSCALARRGHDVTCFEQAERLGEVGAGIQMPPNSARLLLKWGLGEYLDERVVEPTCITFRRWQNGAELSRTALVPDHRQKFGAPYYVVHRAHFHDSLHQLALKLGAKVKIASRVIEYDPETPSITLANGEVHYADLIVAADGINSIARETVTGARTDSRNTGFAAYRATIDVDKIKADPEIAWIVEEAKINLWVGDGRHVMTYPIASGESFNLVLSHPLSGTAKKQSPSEVLEEMRLNFEGWDSRLIKLMSLIHTTMKWPLCNLPSISTYVHSASKMIILGDGAHAMLPYMSQGAAMAVEDGAALAEALHLASSPEDIPEALRIWNAVRWQRGCQMQEASSLNGILWHFKDGPEQEARDAAMRLGSFGKDMPNGDGIPGDTVKLNGDPNQWNDRETSQWCFGYDTEEAVRRYHSLQTLAKL
ncbi:hypothetical protein LTR64_001523 [Lithohypha guttulata]|uniref:uncharacterized protein n=1 Tax=Lithohypha guttulata TaxID=1690604 RepID=UPI002DDFFF71|nr:hypothetical protein LTR51_003717 [Lithohypha guttulata]